MPSHYKNDADVYQLQELTASGNKAEIQEFCEAVHPAVIAELIAPLDRDEAWAILRFIDFPYRAEIFSHLDGNSQVELVSTLPRWEVAQLLAEMAPDDRADLFKQLPEELRESVLPALAYAEREDIRRLAAYEEGTAGSEMTSDYAAITPDLTAYEAIERLREIAPDRETIYYAYVVDEQRKLIGFVSLKDLILARRGQKVREFMHQDIISAHVEDDPEDAARKIQKYDILALPVLNSEGALVGIITHDDAMDIITQEQTEDMEKLMAISGSHEQAMYMKTSALIHFKNRSPWIIALAVLGLLSGLIVQNFENLLMQFAILATFMPMLADTGGNTGSQSATLVIRALALKEIAVRDIFRILGKEAQVALLLGVLLGVIAFLRVLFLGGGATMPEEYSLYRIGIAISLALGLQVITSTLVGALLPLGAAKMKWDPALVASPALTTVVDITGLLIFFFTVRWVMGI